jgi:D-arginine dehydrogenase
MTRYDVAVIGAGMAGASLAAELAPRRSVLILEAEDRPGYHATGRSAALWHETYGGPHVQPLTRASRQWFDAPPEGFGETTFLTRRGVVAIGREQDRAALEEFERSYAGLGVEFVRLDRAALELHCPGLRAAWVHGLDEPGCSDIDVAAVHQAYLRAAARAGAVLQCRAELMTARRDGDGWIVETRSDRFSCDVLVNAAGAWADAVAGRAGARPIGIAPYRRTMVQLRLDREIPREMRMITDIGGSFYFKPDGSGGLWLSPHDEIPSVPTDAAPEEIDVAVAIDRLEQAVEWTVRQVTHKWAGLRSFAPDRLPVYGFDSNVPGFFWMAGQGGFGIQTAPAAARLAAALITGAPAHPMVAAIDPARYSPARFT